MRRRALAAALALACVAALAAAPLPVSAHINDVRADAQVSTDGTVMVETAYVADDAWLAVYRDDDGERGELLGVRRLDGAGFRTDFPVTIDEEHWRDWPAGEARTVHVALHNEKGSGGFDREEDEVLTSFGREATDQFLLERGPGAYVGTRGFSPQDTAGPSVTVRTVRLPSDGYVVARNVTDVGGPNETALEPVGATALDAGTHENVTIALNRSYYERQGARPRLGITVYADDGDDTFGAGDEPVRAGEAPVTTFLFLNRTDGGGDGSGTDDGESSVTTATATGTDDDGNLVTTATATGTATAEPTATPEPEEPTPGEETGDGSTATGGQPGFGALVAALALTAVLVGRARRRRT